MTFKPLKTSVAIASAVGLALAGLTSVPASATVGDVSISPTTGIGTSAFTTDSFKLTTTLSTQVGSTQLSYRIDNPDQHTLFIDTEGSYDADIIGIKADGSYTVTGGDLGTEVSLANTGLVIPFEELGIVSLLVVEIDGNDKNHELTIQLAENAITVADIVAADALEYADATAPVAITVNAWVETTAGASVAGTVAAAADYATIDAAFADTTTVTFIHPDSVSPISKIERFAAVPVANSNVKDKSQLEFVNVHYTGTADVTSAATGTNPMDDGDTIDGVGLELTDLVLVTGQTDSTKNGIYQVTAVATASTAILTDLSGLTISVLEGTAGANKVFLGTADSAYDSGLTKGAGDNGASVIARIADPIITATAADTVNDPKLVSEGNDVHNFTDGDVVIIVDTSTSGAKTAKYTIEPDATAPTPIVEIDDFTGNVSVFNAAAQTELGGSLRFSNPSLNLAQVDLAKWQVEVESSAGAADGFTETDFAGAIDILTPSGYSKTDGLGRLTFTIPNGDKALNESATYNLSVEHDGAATAEFKSAGYQVVASPAADADFIAATNADTVNVEIEAVDAGSYPVKVRNGTAAVTFKAQVFSAADTETEKANVPVLAVVTAGSGFPKGETLLVSGTSDRVLSSSSSVVTSGLTNLDGQFSVTVTSSDSKAAGSTYDVQFYVLDSTSDLWLTTHDNSGSALYKVDYQAPVIAATGGFGTDVTVASGSSITLSFDVVDQFGEFLSATAAGKAYSVELSAPDKDNLKLYAPVVNGTATFTFDNYLGEGASDVLSGKLYTGTSTNPSASDFVSGKTDSVTIYNTNAVVGVNVAKEIAGVEVEYTDFFDGKVTGTVKAPADSNKTLLSGTVVDSNGAGIPGAQVVVSGTGFAFISGTTYSVDTVTVTANSGGAFSVNFWTHVASAAGTNLTVTSGATSTTTLVKSAMPATMLAGNLKFSWDVPANPVFNTTYAVTATLKDVWGNPVSGAPITFTGLAAAQFNGASTAADRRTAADGTTIAYLRSLKDVDGLAAIGAELTAAPAAGVTTITGLTSVITTDVANTSWDERTWDNNLEQRITFGTTAVVASADQKVNAGSFKGYVALYAKGYEGQRMSAKVGNDWVIVPSIPAATNDLFRAVEFVGAGVEISVRLYIDRVLIDTIPLLTK